MAYDVASGTGMPDASSQPGLMDSPSGGLDNLQAASATGGFVLSPVEHDPFASSSGQGSAGGGSSAGSDTLELEPALGHGTLTESDKKEMAPYSQSMFDTHVSDAGLDKSGPKGTPAPALTDEIMSPSVWPDFVSNLQNGEVPFDELPEEYKKALKGKESDYELMRMGITRPLASLTKSFFDPSAGLAGKEGGRVGEFKEGTAPAVDVTGLGVVPASDKSKAPPSAPSGKFPEAQAMYAQLVQGLPDGKGGYIVAPLPPALAAAKVGSSMGESYTKLDPLAKGDPVKTKAGTIYTAHGLDQWHSDRYRAMQDWVKSQGGDPNSREWQAWYGSYEMQHNHALMAAVSNLKDPSQMVPLIVHMHEGAAPATAHIPDRQGYANAVFGGNTILDTDNSTAIPVLGYDPKSGLASSGPQVKTMQSLLAGIGYYHGDLDGQFGPKTRAAVKLFQAQNRDTSGASLAPDGKIGLGPSGKTGNALFQAYANKYGLTDKVSHLLPQGEPEQQPQDAIYSPGFESGGAGSTGVFTPSALRDLNTGVSRGAPSPAPPVSRSPTNTALKSSAMPQQLRGWSGDQISSGLTMPSPDQNALFGAPVMPPGVSTALDSTNPVSDFKSTFPARPEIHPQQREPGVTDPTEVVDRSISSALGAATDLPGIRRALASAGVLDPASISDVPPGRVGWPNAGDGVPKQLTNEEFPGRPRFPGGSEFQTWYRHIQETQPQTQGLIQRGAKSRGISEESYAKDLFKRVQKLQDDQRAKDLSGEQRSELDGAQVASADNPYNGPVDKHGLPLETQERKYYFRDPASEMDSKLMNKKEYFKNYPDATESDWQQYMDNAPPSKVPGEGGWQTPTSRRKERSKGAGVIV